MKSQDLLVRKQYFTQKIQNIIMDVNKTPKTYHHQISHMKLKYCIQYVSNRPSNYLNVVKEDGVLSVIFASDVIFLISTSGIVAWIFCGLNTASGKTTMHLVFY